VRNCNTRNRFHHPSKVLSLKSQLWETFTSRSGDSNNLSASSCQTDAAGYFAPPHSVLSAS